MIKFIIINFLLFLFGLCSESFAAPPDWAVMSPRRDGSLLTLACDGFGPSQDLAIRMAIGRCISIVSDEKLTNFQVNTLSVETEQYAAFHEEISTNQRLEGLACDVKRQSLEVDNGSYRAWIQCSVDTANARLVPVDSENLKQESSLAVSESQSVLLSAVPMCDSIIIKGVEERIIRCIANPTTLIVKPGDYEFIVRAKGFVPEHLSFKDIHGGVLGAYLQRE